VRYGIIEAGERPIGLNRTSRLRDGAAGTINNDAMAWILDHTDQEKETQNSIEYNDMHGRIKAWLKGKGGMRRRREHNGSFGHISGGTSLAKAILSRMYVNMQKIKALEDRKKSPLHGPYYRFA